MLKQVFVFAAFVAICLFPSVARSTPDVIVLPGAKGKAGTVIPIAVESPDDAIASHARRAFRLHGGYTLVPVSQADFTFQIERLGMTEVLLTVLSGNPAEALHKETISGRTSQAAVLKACDRAVERTLGKSGFFAGKLAFVLKKGRGVSEIYTSDLLFDNVRPLTLDRSLVTGPRWSPDGKKLLYTTYHKTGFPDIYLMDLEQGLRIPVARFKGTNTGACFSPNGSRIAMSLSMTGNSEIYVSDTSGRRLRRLTRDRSLKASPSWSPDGRRLVYTSDIRGKPQLYEITVDGGQTRRLPTKVSTYCSEPAWNPIDSDLIAFTAAVKDGFQIALYHAKKSQAEILTSIVDSAVEPVWLNDGRHLVFTRRQGGRTSLMLLDTKTGQTNALHSLELGDVSAANFVY